MIENIKPNNRLSSPREDFRRHTYYVYYDGRKVFEGCYDGDDTAGYKRACNRLIANYLASSIGNDFVIKDRKKYDLFFTHLADTTVITRNKIYLFDEVCASEVSKQLFYSDFLFDWNRNISSKDKSSDLDN